MTDIAKIGKEGFGYTDEQISSLTDNQKKFLANVINLRKYKIVAEVVESHNCGWRAKVGDKIVLGGTGWLWQSQCTNKENTCILALVDLAPFVMMVCDRVANGLDPSDILFKRVRCKDTGVGHCGWGEIVMEVRTESAE